MLNLDLSSEFGARVQRRLRDEELAWLTTVDRTGTPRSVPVWFYWDGETVLIFSEPGDSSKRGTSSAIRGSASICRPTPPAAM